MSLQDTVVAMLAEWTQFTASVTTALNLKAKLTTNTFSGAQTHQANIGTAPAASIGAGTTAGWRLRSDGLLEIAAAANPVAILNRLTSDGAIQQFARQGATVGSISVTTTATAYNTSSDYRLKTDIEPLGDALTRLAELKPSRFRFISDPNAGLFDGFIAHEVQQVCPQAVTGELDGDEMQAMDASKLMPLAIAAIQELVARVEALEA